MLDKYIYRYTFAIENMVQLPSETGHYMKAIYIGNKKFREIDLLDLKRDEDYLRLINEYSLMESPIVYFSAGESKIKEILIKKDPSFSA
jgi:hypothetical protein